MTVLAANIRIRRGAFTLDAQFAAPLTGVTAVFGPSGAGKSMLLSAVAGLQRLDSGRVSLGDRVLADTNAGIQTPAHERGLGLVFQNTRLFPHLSVRSNLRYAQDRAQNVRALTTLDAAAANFDIEALLDRPVRNLSGGERSRVALARAILSAPDVLLLDEPFAALDGLRRHAFLAMLRSMHVTLSIPLIVVTHQIEDAAFLADHLVGLKEGRVVANGLLAEVATLKSFQTLLDPHDIGAAVPTSVFRGEVDQRASVWVRADHVLLSTQRPVGLSARNVWEARVSELSPEKSSILVRVEAPFGALFARVTAEAAQELAIEPGQTLWAIVKAHAI